MGGELASKSSHAWGRWLPRPRVAVRLAACFLWVTFASVIVGYVEQWKPENNLLWVANGLILAYLLLAPRKLWPAYLLTGFLALSLRMLLLSARRDEFLLYNLLDMIEVTTGALLLRRRSFELPRFTTPAYLVRFFAFAVLAGPMLAGAVYALVLPFLRTPAPPHPFLSWAISDSLGIAISTPAFVAVFQTRLRHSVDWRRNWFFPALLLAVAIVGFSQDTFPLICVVYPLLVLVLVRVGLGYASLFTLMVAAIAGWLTIQGSGLFAAMRTIDPALPSRMLQIAMASAMFLIYTVSVVLEKQRASERRLEEIVVLHNMVMEHSRDVIMLIDFDGRPRFISPAVYAMTGWKPDETMRRGFAEVAHPDDLPRIEQLMGRLRRGADSAVIEYRIRRRGEGYIWVEGSFRALRGTETGRYPDILQMVRDISERKRAQQQLQNAYHAVEALAITDALTGLANRRRFDQCLSSEWRRGMRERKPLSMLLLDVDLFKSYNDNNGHLRGDSCLKQIAEAAMDVVVRPGDLVARFGGEEFAIILPNTGNEGAMELADEVCEALYGRKLPHSGSPHGFVSVSVGCATMVPSLGQHATSLIEVADEALYKAKRNGRNRVCNGNTMQRGPGEPQGCGASATRMGKTA